MIIIFASTFQAFSFERLFPILGYGLDKTFFSGLTNIYALGGISILYFLMPLLKESHHFKRVSIVAIIISSIFLIGSVGCLSMVFSFTSGTDFSISIYSLTRQIEYGRFIQRTESFFILLWILALMSYISVAMALCLIIFKKITNISNSNALSYLFALIIFTFGFITQNVATREIYK